MCLLPHHPKQKIHQLTQDAFALPIEIGANKEIRIGKATAMANEKTPLIPSGVTPPSDASGSQPTVYFLERRDSNVSHHTSNNITAIGDAEEIETIPEGSTVESFKPRPVVGVGSVTGESSSRSLRANKRNSWFNFFKNVGKKSNAFAATGGGTLMSSPDTFPRSAPVKIDPKVFFANERTFLAWMHVSVILAGASVAIVAFTDTNTSAAHQVYGVILLPVSIAFILYSMSQCKSFIYHYCLMFV